MRRALLLFGAGFTLGLTGCTSGTTNDDPAPVTTTGAGSSSSAAPSTSASPVELAGSCPDLLPITTLTEALGVGLPGSVSYVRGQPIPDIGRTDRITCGFGTVPAPSGSPSGAPAPAPLLEISVSSYVDPAAAADRIEVTTTDRTAAGDRVATTEVDGLPAVALTSPTATTLVFADGPWTYSLTLAQAVVPQEEMLPRLVSVATALRAEAAG